MPPKYSQNFLIDPTVLPKIIQAAALNSNDTVIEIGPGKGILTEQLCQSAGQVIAIEIDQTLIAGLLLLQNKYPNLQIINADFTTFNWLELVAARPYKIVANIPYHVTGLIIRHIFRPDIRLPQSVTLMIQDEVARKIIPDECNHSVLSNLVRLFGQPAYVAQVGRQAFQPAPRVDSAIITVKNIAPPDVPDFQRFFRMIKMAFASRRKTLLNNLAAGLQLDKDIVRQMLDSAGIDPQRRAQTLSLNEWRSLYYKIEHE